MRFLLMLIGLGLFVGALTLGWTFRANNEAPVHLDLIWFQLSGLALWQVILGTLALGASLASLFLGFALLRSKMVGRRFKKMVTKLEKEVHELRSLPLVGSDPTGSSLDLKVPEPSVAADGSVQDGPAQSAAKPASKPPGRLAGVFRSGSSAKKG